MQVRSCTRVGVYEFVCKPPLDQPRFHYIPHRSSDYSRIKTRSKNLYKYIYIYICNLEKATVPSMRDSSVLNDSLLDRKDGRKGTWILFRGPSSETCPHVRFIGTESGNGGSFFDVVQPRDRFLSEAITRPLSLFRSLSGIKRSSGSGRDTVSSSRELKVRAPGAFSL